MATNPYTKVMPQLGQVVQNYDPNASVEKPAVLPIYNQQPVAEPGNTSASAIAMRNMFRVNPTPQQAMAVGASPVSETERDAEINQLKVDAARREAAAKQPVYEFKQQKKIDPNSTTDGMEALLYTSPQREEELRKASVQRQRIMAIGDALRHIGNIYNTVNYAPAQQFNSPVEEERQRYLKEKAVRDNNNYKYLTYQQAKRAQEQKMKQWEADYRLKVADAARKAGYTEAQIKNMQDKLAQQKSYQEQTLALRKLISEAQQKERERHNLVAERQGQQRIGISAMNAKNMQEYRKWKMEGGGGKSTQSIPLRSPYGIINAPGRSIPQAQWNQAYADFEKKGWIKKGDFERRMEEAGVHGKSDPDYVRNRLVAEVIAKNGEASNYMRDNFRWTYDNNPTASSQQPAQQGYTLPQWQWGQQQTPAFDPLMPTSSQADEDDEEDLFDDDMNFSGISI